MSVAWLLSWQAAGFALQSPAPAAACCCAHRGEENCRCPVCSHAREVASGQPSLRSCGDSAAPAVAPAARPALAAVFLSEPALSPQPQPRFSPPEPAPAVSPEVPTPPPLA